MGGIENRKHLRLSAMGPIQIVVQGGAAQIGYLASIGRGGLGLYMHQDVHPGQLVLASLHLFAHAGESEDLKVVARVRWAQAVAPLWMVGLAFEQMSDARYARLLKHLDLIEAWQCGNRAIQMSAAKARVTVKE